MVWQEFIKRVQLLLLTLHSVFSCCTHSRPNKPLRFPVGLMQFIIAANTECMIERAFVFGIIIGANIFDQTQAGFNDLFSQQPGDTDCRFIRQDTLFDAFLLSGEAVIWYRCVPFR